jgi:hypothetical protein
VDDSTGCNKAPNVRLGALWGKCSSVEFIFHKITPLLQPEASGSFQTMKKSAKTLVLRVFTCRKNE